MPCKCLYCTIQGVLTPAKLAPYYPEVSPIVCLINAETGNAAYKSGKGALPLIKGLFTLYPERIVSSGWEEDGMFFTVHLR